MSSSKAIDLMGLNDGDLLSVLTSLDQNSSALAFLTSSYSSSITVPHSSKLALSSPLTITAWVKSTSRYLPISQTIASKGERVATFGASQFSFFDLTTATTSSGGALASNAKGFVSAVSDGRYIYLVPDFNNNPDYHGIVPRFDTRSGRAFTSAASWSFFDYSTASTASGGALAANSRGTVGAVFDGRYLYFSPSVNYATWEHGRVARYDTQTSQSYDSSATAWSFFDVTTATTAPGGATLAANAIGFRGATYDGRYVYFVPRNNGAINGIFARYDTTTTLSFNNSTNAWSFFDTSTVNANAKSYSGGIFDGRYMYFVPSDSNPSAVVLRYDTQTTLSFSSSGAAWSFFDLTTATGAAGGAIASCAKNFLSGSFDGRYLYFIPFNNGCGTTVAARYDTQTTLSFSSSASAWSFFDLKTATTAPIGGALASSAANFVGGVSDGRYLYFVPYSSGIMARYDQASSVPFNASSSAWAFFDMTTATSAQGGSLASSVGFGSAGATFDGRYIYIPPRWNAGHPSSIVTQIDTAATQTAFELRAGGNVTDATSVGIIGPSFQIATQSGFYQAAVSSPLSSGWHMIAGVYDGSTVMLYTDGSLVNSMAATGSLLSTTNPFEIGAYGHSLPGFSGSMNDIQVFSRALSASDIRTLYTNGSSALCR